MLDKAPTILSSVLPAAGARTRPVPVRGARVRARVSSSEPWPWPVTSVLAQVVVPVIVGLRDRAQAVVFAYEAGLVRPANTMRARVAGC